MDDTIYSYVLEELPDNSYVYHIDTQGDVEYNVYFRTHEYDDYLVDYPHLLENGYGFGFFHIPIEDVVLKANDTRLFATIRRIVREFIDTHGTNVVLLYHCDYTDGRQKARERMFTSWYNKSRHNQVIDKLTIEVVKADDGGEEKHYMGCLTHKDNPDILEVKEEFEKFAFSLANENKR